MLYQNLVRVNSPEFHYSSSQSHATRTDSHLSELQTVRPVVLYNIEMNDELKNRSYGWVECYRIFILILALDGHWDCREV